MREGRSDVPLPKEDEMADRLSWVETVTIGGLSLAAMGLLGWWAVIEVSRALA